MDLPKKKVLMKVFITSLFSYCPLIWMLHTRTLNNRINNTHERVLRLTYKDNKSSFKQLLEKDHSMTVHQKNLQVLVTEIFKVKNNLAPDIMKDVFELKEPPYNLRSEPNHFTCQMLRLLSMVSYQLSTNLHKYGNLFHKALENVRH